MIAEGLAETGHIVVATLACIVRCMYAYAEVEADDEEVQVVADAYACTECYLLSEVLEAELTAGLVVATAQQPHIACVYEGCSLQFPDDGEAILQVYLKFEIAHLVDV